MLDPLASADLAQDQVFIAIQLRWNDRQDRLSNDFFRRPAEDALSRPVPAFYDSIQVLADDGIIRGFGDCSQPERGLLRRLGCGHVPVLRTTALDTGCGLRTFANGCFWTSATLHPVRSHW